MARPAYRLADRTSWHAVAEREFGKSPRWRWPGSGTDPAGSRAKCAVEVEHLKDVLATQPVIKQAKGVICCCGAGSSEQAFRALREVSHRCGCRKSRPRMSNGISVLVEDSPESILPAYHEAFDPVGFKRLGPGSQREKQGRSTPTEVVRGHDPASGAARPTCNDDAFGADAHRSTAQRENRSTVHVDTLDNPTDYEPHIEVVERHPDGRRQQQRGQCRHEYRW
ncbi:ANTAR domain-containing protein [Amycolatopsis sp. NPDC051128]|uniref:ANTAR domain-containing protein n=1 Tax=Amycolatopsis sp. NPDC051128 TaxID=3155412 RepID=UPI00342F7D07